MKLEFLKFIKDGLKEDNGKPSGMRINTAWMVFWFVLVLALGFIVTVFKYEGIIIAFAALLVGAVLGALGIKNSQKDKEQNVDRNEQQ